LPDLDPPVTGHLAERAVHACHAAVADQPDIEPLHWIGLRDQIRELGGRHQQWADQVGVPAAPVSAVGGQRVRQRCVAGRENGRVVDEPREESGNA
jgi:hypothetical protein